MSTEKKKAVVGNRRNGLVGILLAAIAVLIVVVLVVIELNIDGSITVTNNSSKNVASLRMYYETTEGVDFEPFFESAIAKGQTLKVPYEAVDFASQECIICFEVTYEGEKTVWMHDGDFTRNFDGRISILFYDEDGENCMHAKACRGLFGDTKFTDVDTDFYIYPDKEDWNYKY